MSENMPPNLPEASLVQPLAYESVTGNADLRFVVRAIALLMAGEALQSLFQLISQMYVALNTGSLIPGVHAFWVTIPVSLTGLTAALAATVLFQRQRASLVVVIIHEITRILFVVVMGGYQLFQIRAMRSGIDLRFIFATATFGTLCLYALELTALVLILRRCRDRGALS